MDKYEYMAFIHKVYFPYMRIGQFLSNFAAWIQKEFGKDFFYLEDDEVTPLLEQFAKTVKRTH